jgi:DNA-binding SARP family transcriptional activator/streptogramin lyase
MQFQVLGPLAVVGENGPVFIGRGKRRTLLGLLLLNVNEVVPYDRLIDEIWGAAPPSTARSALHVLVSELRKALRDEGAETLLTHSGGYVLKVAAEDLDVRLFERLLNAGRNALPADPETAEERLREALALWRGSALQDFAYDDFARTEIGRLEELHLQAEEELVEAELARGGGEDLVPKLEALIARNPKRERPRGQLILALYRAQRQTEALEAYADARRILVHELGVEPSPALQRLQQAILQQDPALEANVVAPSAEAPGIARRGRRPLIAPLAALLAVAGLGIGLLLILRSGTANPPPPLTAAPARSIAVIDPANNRLVDAIQLEPRPLATTLNPQAIAVAYGAVWVTDGGQQTLIRIDPKKRAIVQTIGIGADVRALAVGFGSLWIADGNSAAVTRIDPRTNRVTATIPLGNTAGVPNNAFAIAAGGGSVWTTAGANTIDRIDPATNQVVERIRVPEVYSLTANNRFAWVGTWLKESEIFRLAPQGSHTAVEKFAALQPGSGVGALAIRGNSLWAIVANGTTQLFEYDATTGEIVSTPDVGHASTSLAVTNDAVWVSNDDGYVARLESRDRTRVRRISVRKDITWIAAGEGAIWVAVPH